MKGMMGMGRRESISNISSYSPISSHKAALVKTIIRGDLMPLVLVLAALFLGAQGGQAEGPAGGWEETARQVHSRFTGRNGTFAAFGDSITVTNAFWAPLRDSRRNAPPEMERAFR